jgi:thiol peroxidase
MQERSDVFTFGGKPFTLLGPELKVGDTAPEATVLANDLSPVQLSSYKGKICVVSVVSSLDTATCDIQTRKFNEEAGNLAENVVILTISTDLPFAQARWCGAAGVDKVVTLSDHRDVAFGQAFGVLIKELRLLARSVYVIDPDGIIQYIQLVKEGTGEPDYNAVLEAVKKLV